MNPQQRAQVLRQVGEAVRTGDLGNAVALAEQGARARL